MSLKSEFCSYGREWRWVLGSPPCAPVSLRCAASQPVCVPSVLLSFPFLLFPNHLLVPAACWALVVQDEYEKKESCTSWPLLWSVLQCPPEKSKGQGRCNRNTCLTNLLMQKENSVDKQQSTLPGSTSSEPLSLPQTQACCVPGAGLQAT